MKFIPLPQNLHRGLKATLTQNYGTMHGFPLMLVRRLVRGGLSVFSGIITAMIARWMIEYFWDTDTLRECDIERISLNLSAGG